MDAEFESTNIPTHIWTLQPFSHDYNLVFHAIYVLGLRDLQSKIDSERQIFEMLFTLRDFTDIC